LVFPDGYIWDTTVTIMITVEQDSHESQKFTAKHDVLGKIL